jgi:hypothetical protein
MCVLPGCLAAQDSTKTSAPAPAQQTRKTAAPAPLALPKDAVETEAGFYRWTDKDGKVWNYRLTPFGVRRWPEASASTGRDVTYKHDAMGERTTAVAEGDSIRFSQATPFGKRTWVRKKTELNETERRIWDLQQKNSAASRAAEKE